MFKALISIPGTEVEKRRGKGIGKRKGKEKGGAAFRITDILSTQNMDPHTPYIALGFIGKFKLPISLCTYYWEKSLTLTRGHRICPRNAWAHLTDTKGQKLQRLEREVGVVTFLSHVLGLPVVFCLRKPAVVDHRVGFFLDGSSEEKLLSLTEVERPLKAGSLLRRTWSGISTHTRRGLGLAEMNTTLGKTHFIQRLATED